MAQSHSHDHHGPAPNAIASPEEAARAKDMWAHFTAFAKYAVGATIVVLVLMAWFLL